MLLLQVRDAAGMIGVMMCHQDVGEAPSFFGERGFDRGCFRCVDRRRAPGRRIVQQNAVIVLEAEENMRLGRHGWLATPAWRRQATTALRYSMRNLPI